MNYNDIIKNKKIGCEKCKSAEIILFESRNVPGAVAYACWNCKNMQVFSKDIPKLTEDIINYAKKPLI